MSKPIIFIACDTTSTKKVRKIIIMLVVITNNRLVLNPKFDDAKTLGIIKKMIKGLTIPPVK